ncbi:hypothetical protein B0T16DRAFT_405547 [Cercophora newfieldiana]|uniref:P-loop containing nucleoside triphosphate hydrolase protein n=1 Tax=Cercophora newfieldiana TaxID=92897 RepID=A0AA40CWX0_9PEZI|nr:hypothetical protein B0T16DRAFT_405547 [Cercophora newfieldiana]
MDELAPSICADCVTFPSQIGDNGRIIQVELYDFPGTASFQRPSQLFSKFFHGVLICYGVDDTASLSSVLTVWKPLLDNALIECPRFVVGLKSDTRPEHPTVQLSFDPKPEMVTPHRGTMVANDMRADGWAECSALHPELVQFVWKEILEDVVSRVDRGEYDLKRLSSARPSLGRGIAAIAATMRRNGGRL